VANLTKRGQVANEDRNLEVNDINATEEVLIKANRAQSGLKFKMTFYSVKLPAYLPGSFFSNRSRFGSL